MTTEPLFSKTIGSKAWIAVRFVLFGVGGFLVMFLSWIDLIGRTTDSAHRQNYFSPFLSLPLAFVGAVMMLLGVGEWKRWAYLWVFLSIPLSLSILLVLPSSFGSGKDFGAMLPGVAAIGSYAIVRRYYRRRDFRREETTNP